MHKRFRCSLLCGALLLVLLSRLAAVPPPEIADKPNPVLPVPTAPAATDQLVTITPSKEMSAQRLAIVAKGAKPGLTAEEQQKVEQELVTFDQGLVTGWASHLTFADGRTFSRKFTPAPIVDAHLASLFPAARFYLANFPGYFGGAYPTQEMLRNYDVPSPLGRLNIFAVSKDATIQLLIDEKSRQAFFQAALPPITTAALARTAVAGWLRLAEEFIWRYNQHPAFIITEQDIVVKELHGDMMNLEATGKAVVDPKSNAKGDITVTMRFAVDGKLQLITETPQVQFGFIPLPPSAAPHGGPGGIPKMPAS